MPTHPPRDFPTTPVVAPLSHCRFPSRLDTVIDFVRSFKSPRYANTIGEPNSIALRTKRLIDDSFEDPIPLNEISTFLKCSPSALSRYFKRTYEITPVEYRNKMRVTDSIRHLVRGNRVTDAAQKAGFSDLSQFNRQFSREMQAVPSAFRFSNWSPSPSRDLFQQPQLS